MRKFIIQVALFTLLYLVVIVTGLLITRITKPQNLHFGLIDKHNKLSIVNPPRIVFVGGSNLSFGINSRKIQEQLHLSVINTAVHAGMGFKYIIEDIIPYLKRNDIVVLSTEYSQFYGSGLYGNEPMVSSVIALPETFHLMNWQNWKSISCNLPERAIKNILKFFVSIYREARGIENIGVYDRTSFNEFGDVVAHFGKPKESFNPTDNISGDYNKQTIVAILRLKEEVEKKEGKLLFAYPCLMQTSFNSITIQVDKINKEIIKNGIETIGTPGEYSLPDSLYFNSPYHLIKEGVDLRTNLLINDLKKHDLSSRVNQNLY